MNYPDLAFPACPVSRHMAIYRGSYPTPGVVYRTNGEYSMFSLSLQNRYERLASRWYLYSFMQFIGAKRTSRKRGATAGFPQLNC